MRTRTRTILAGLALGATLAGGVAWATTTTEGTIHGCYVTKSGALRIVDGAEACKKNELAISWNKQGVKGDPGAAGVDGIDGTDGKDGLPGADGLAGVRGETGAKGKDGADGRDGARGEACLPDTPGCRGPQGDKGEPGPAGADGAACLPSNPACVGPRGPAGSSGGGGFTTTRVIVPPAPSPGPDVFNVLLTSPEWGTVEATCDRTLVNGGSASRSELQLYLSSTATDAYLYVQGWTTPYDRVVPRGTPGSGSILALQSTTPLSSFYGTRFTLTRFGTNPDGSASVAERVLALGAEILSDGSCRTTIGLENI